MTACVIVYVCVLSVHARNSRVQLGEQKACKCSGLVRSCPYCSHFKEDNKSAVPVREEPFAVKFCKVGCARFLTCRFSGCQWLPASAESLKGLK